MPAKKKEVEEKKSAPKAAVVAQPPAPLNERPPVMVSIGIPVRKPDKK
jgi:hypothetical protein